ncbi:MAG: site-specific integrase [Deltaproteobacteria bacterium]|nr:site-specific integrase [Deltaproteobacteria bacterium]
MAIKDIGFRDITLFITSLTCSAKRINNILVPMRSLFQYAMDAGIIEKNPFSRVRNQKVVKPEIHPLSMDEVSAFLNFVPPLYKNFFVVAFFTGMRFGEMAALDWRHVDFERGLIRITKTRVNGEEGSPKTKKSFRDIKMMPPVIDALKDQKKLIAGKSDYVFLNHYGRPLHPHSVNLHVWQPTLIKAGLVRRSLYQTRHTFATLMLDSGELPGWVQQMMGHVSLQMILEKYYSYIKNYQRDDGNSFMENVFQRSVKQNVAVTQP